jgi:hypothetical protein
MIMVTHMAGSCLEFAVRPDVSYTHNLLGATITLLELYHMYGVKGVCRVLYEHGVSPSIFGIAIIISAYNLWASATVFQHPGCSVLHLHIVYVFIYV